jgi:peptidyl-prolyl cis-trans isomerase C
MNFLKTTFQNPLLHFLLLGAGLFLLYQLVRPDASADDIIILDDEAVSRSVGIFQKEWGRQPSREELKGLLESQIKQEVFYRQALKMNLDHNDELIKRRMQQKLSFITSDLASLSTPSEDSLRVYYQQHSVRYQLPAKVRFSQWYFNPDRRSDPLADAVEMRKSLQSQGMPQDDTAGGDSFVFTVAGEPVALPDLERQMGHAFADTLMKLPTGSWQGPVLSGFGVHLVYVHAVTAPAAPSWEKIRELVLRDYQFEAAGLLNEKVYQDFRRGYKIRLMVNDSFLRIWPLDKMMDTNENP